MSGKKIRTISSWERKVSKSLSLYPPFDKELKTLRTQVILNHAFQTSQLSLTDLDIAISENGDGNKIVFKWERREAEIGKRSAASFDRRAAGCLEIFENPLWILCDQYKNLSYSKIMELVLPYLERDAEWHDIMVRRRSKPRIINGTVWKKEWVSTVDAAYWYQRGGPRSVIALLALYIVAEIRGEFGSFEYLLTMLFRLFPEFAQLPSYKSHWRDLLMVLARRTVFTNLIASRFVVDMDVIQSLVQSNGRVKEIEPGKFVPDPIVYMKHIPERNISDSSALWIVR